MSLVSQTSERIDTPELESLGVHILPPHSGVTVDSAEPWFDDALRIFRSEVGDPEYPCHFGRRALNQGELFVTSVHRDSPERLAAPLAAFLDYVRPSPQRRQVLAAFVNTGGTGPHRANGDLFWSFLQTLHERDDAPWPKGMTTNPSDPDWEFCFHGTPMFVFSAAPTHRLRRSRNLGEALVLLFQPRNVFLGVEGGTRAGTAARRRIRDRLTAWDIGRVHPAMGDYGDPSNLEWRQYVIPENGVDIYPACPFQPRN